MVLSLIKELILIIFLAIILCAIGMVFTNDKSIDNGDIIPPSDSKNVIKIVGNNITLIFEVLGDEKDFEVAIKKS